jgi:hypothetical protein
MVRDTRKIQMERLFKARDNESESDTEIFQLTAPSNGLCHNASTKNYV